MAAYTRHQSALGLALNAKSASVDIPKVRDVGHPNGRDNLTVVSTGANKRPGIANLPSPPSSISPNLAPHQRSHGPVSPTASAAQESDLDLQDAPHNALNAEALDRLGDLESAGAITPGMLSRQYLPDILLANGPLAIRHIMGYLTTSLPGFSRITSAKARRLVVAALEGRGGGSEGAGMDGDVIFEKVGWGRWDARKKGQPPREDQGHITPPGSLPSSYTQGPMQVPERTSWRQASDHLGTSFATSGFTHSDGYHDALEHEVDKMSMDGDDDGYQSSEAPPEAMDIEMDEGDVTDEEDWQSIGAEALRARSLPPGSLPTLGNMSGGGRLYQPISTYSTAPYSTAPRYRSKTPAQLAQSVPSRAIPVQKSGYNFPSGINDSQERAAIEALMSLGSM